MSFYYRGMGGKFCSPNWQRDYKQWFEEGLRHPTLTWTRASLNFCQNKHIFSGRGGGGVVETMLFISKSKTVQVVNGTSQS